MQGDKGRYWSKSTKFQLCKMNNFWKSNVQQCDYSQQYWILVICKRVDLKCFHHRHTHTPVCAQEHVKNGNYVR